MNARVSDYERDIAVLCGWHPMSSNRWWRSSLTKNVLAAFGIRLLPCKDEVLSIFLPKINVTPLFFIIPSRCRFNDQHFCPTFFSCGYRVSKYPRNIVYTLIVLRLGIMLLQRPPSIKQKLHDWNSTVSVEKYLRNSCVCPDHSLIKRRFEWKPHTNEANINELTHCAGIYIY